MQLMDLFREAWLSARTNSVRTLLAVTGVIIGVLAITLMLAVGVGSRMQVERIIAALGSNLLVITPEFDPQISAMSRISSTDVLAINGVPGIIASAPVKIAGQQKISRGALTVDAFVQETSADLFTIRQWQLLAGETLPPPTINPAMRPALLGLLLANELFPDAGNAVGSTIRIGATPYIVVGVLHQVNQNFGEADANRSVFTSFRYDGLNNRGKNDQNNFSAVYVRFQEGLRVDDITSQLASVLQESHHMAKDAPPIFKISNMAGFLNAARESSKTMTKLLGAIASISLLVGGIGIMNMMLVAVAERTREIGIRKAVGATSGNILGQFLAESVIISASGSLIGLVLSFGGATIADHYFQTPAQVTPALAILAILLGAGVGILSGMYPAIRAARLMPIEALRHNN